MLLLVNLVGCARAVVPAPAVENPQFSRRPTVANWSLLKKTWSSPPAEPVQADNSFPVDLRLADMSGLDLRKSGDVLMKYASFDTDTRWPKQKPTKYDPRRILELGKNPGLGVRALHEAGITGRGVHVAFIDQSLLLEHEEYKGRLLKYEEIGQIPMRISVFHY